MILEEASLERNGLMRVPRIPALLLTATLLLSGCCSFNGSHGTGHAWVDSKGSMVQKGGVVQKGGIVQKGHVHQKGESCPKGGCHGVSYQSVMHQNLWNKYEGSACCDAWDPVLGSCSACGVCGGNCEGHTPAQHLKHKLTCASGCGELYWGEWISDPPDRCDPCDNWGNWTGPTGCCEPTCLEKVAAGWHSLFGGHGGKGKGGCSSCGGKGGGKGGCARCGGVAAESYYDDGVLIEETEGEMVPTPQIEDDGRDELVPAASRGFSFRSTRLSR